MLWVTNPLGAQASFHMGLDAYFSQKEIEEPILRIFQFRAPTVTIGFSQTLEQCMAPGVKESYALEYSRRVTGGKALLHQKGITYSLVVPRIYLDGDVITTYRTISQPLFSALRRWNPALCFDSGSNLNRTPNQVCFLEHSVETFHISGIKVVGSAQKRTRLNILQHGQIQLFPPEIDGSEIFQIHRDEDRSKLSSLRDASIFSKEDQSLVNEVIRDIRYEFEKTFGNSKSYELQCRDYTDLGRFISSLSLSAEDGLRSVSRGKEPGCQSEERGGSGYHAT